MGLDNSEQNCAGCEFTRMYDFGKKVYYCGHADRIDDMGKLGVGYLPEGSPGWCPLGHQDSQNGKAER